MLGARTSPAGIWWAILVDRLTQLQALVTPELAGTIQFQIRGPASDARYCFLVLRPGAVSSGAGIASTFDEWVATTESALEAVLFKGTAEGLRVTGDRA